MAQGNAALFKKYKVNNKTIIDLFKKKKKIKT